MKRFLKWFVILFTLLIVSLYIFGYDYLITAVRVTYLNGHTTAFLDDYTEFENRTVQSGTHQPWPEHVNYNKAKQVKELEALHEEYGTVGFLIVKNDSIWFEQYYEDYHKTSRSNSFSMAKSMISAMLGKAIMEGHIKSLDQPVGDFFPEFSKGKAAKMTVGDLSSMASGMNWDERYYSPFSVTTEAYFSEDLRALMKTIEITEEPGQSYEYLSGNTQLLGMVIEKATGKKLSNYLSEKFWKPLGMNDDAIWQLDREDGMEKAYCCVASNVRNFAKFGKLYKDSGNWKGNQILDSSFVQLSVQSKYPDGENYGYGFWLSDYLDKDIFYMRGHLGQYTVVIPEDNLIFVRLGHRAHIDNIEPYIDGIYQMLENDTKN
ncbi:MAG: serine hydrolase [Flavobacteriaceae bacterium]|nr:serine hydrolase [Flavobacteriaceae bacterium]